MSRVDRPTSGKLFVDGARVTDIRQGSLNDCGLLAAAAALVASDATWAERHVHADKTNAKLVRVEIPAPGGKIQGVSIRPTFRRGAKTGPNNELWVAALEKGYAQMRGGYDNIEYASAAKVLSDLTGKPCTSIAMPTALRTWELLSSRAPVLALTVARDRSWLGRCIDGLVAPFVALGLALGFGGYRTNHGYAVLGVGSDAQHGRFVRVYDPAGTDAVTDGANDGVCRIPIEEFCRRFSMLTLT